LLQLPQRKTVEDRLSEIFPDIELYGVEVEAEGVKIHGFMSSPENSRSTTHKLYSYVNRRAVRDRFLTRMMIDSYGRLIDKGKFPQGVLFIEIDSDQVDVNVHPTKNEVRFKRAKLVGDLIKASVFEMLRNSPWIKGYRQRVENAVKGFYERRESFEPAWSDSPNRPPSLSHLPSYMNEDESLQNIASSNSVGYETSYSPELKAPSLFAKDGFFSELEIIGQIAKLYIVCESKRGMILIDQHAAHERVNYEKLKKAHAVKNRLDKQELLIPMTIELSPYEFKLMEKHKEEIESLGITLESFGKGSFLIRSIPTVLENGDLERILKDMIGEIALLDEGKSVEQYID
ncbi:MAG: DNA mismatch repair endonuclease MutL, partial [Thermodesulfobacteriota bacterium]